MRSSNPNLKPTIHSLIHDVDTANPSNSRHVMEIWMLHAPEFQCSVPSPFPHTKELRHAQRFQSSPSFIRDLHIFGYLNRSTILSSKPVNI